jgi:hypothetical protein
MEDYNWDAGVEIKVKLIIIYGVRALAQHGIIQGQRWYDFD